MIALPGSLEKVAREALAATRVWVKEELDLDLRVAVVPIGDIRAAGLDVRVARYSASPFVTYAMFSGGGTSWAEKARRWGASASRRPRLAPVRIERSFLPLESDGGPEW